MNVLICDRNQAVVDACLAVGLDAVQGSIFDHPSEGIVSPANSFGFMDGGIDLAYSERFGWHVQDAVQAKIVDKFEGELLIGQALTVATKDPGWPFLIAAPTMRVPMVIPDANHVRMATRAAMREAMLHDMASIVFPGMGAGCGQVRPEWVACMMKAGVEDALNPKPFPRSLHVASAYHYAVQP